MAFRHFYNNKRRTGSSQGNMFSTPSNETIKKFIQFSKKRQTFYGNCEGSFGRQCFKVNDTEFLKHFIFCSLFYKLNASERAKEDEGEKSLVESIVEEIKKQHKNYSINDEIHLFIVWVYFFEYASGETKHTPLFKIYKSKTKDEAVFFDINKNVYVNWRHYLDAADLPTCFLCFPKNGAYVFDDDSKSLELIYMYFERHHKALFTEPASAPFVPFCDSFIRPLISDKIWQKIVHIKEKLWLPMTRLWHDKPILKIVLILVAVAGALIVRSSLLKHHILSDLKFMLLNPLGFVLSSFKEVGDFSHPNAATKNGAGTVENLLDIFQNSASALDEGFEMACSRLSANHPSLGRVLTNVRGLIRLLSMCGEMKKLLPNTNADYFGGRVVQRRNSSKSNLKNLEDDEVRVRAIQKFFPCVLSMEDESFENVLDKAYEEAKSEPKSEAEEEFSPLSVPIDEGDVQDQIFYAFSEPTLPEISKGLPAELKGLSFKPRQEFLYDLVDDEGTTKAVLFYPKEECAVVCVTGATEKSSKFRLAV